ncbi:DUF1002 domain-containing protein [Oceanobacillus neutriphilus]|uniref:DUF1002 domain-containing protein n=1 Tax=Oceanobacillus neutriphilus TaxID=531815 RepID=A0ABQ2NR57_9BACI|nr:DUF1002 domain-containing protein [Oceanobacillus neutriphilus]GGP09755.1 hypothetical protein GCM10011346_15130 [Oceanobacillus neutriphilus]
MNKKLVSVLKYGALSLILFFSILLPVSATSNTTIIYGEKLNDSQRTEVREILGISDDDTYEEHDVTGQDYADFINGNPDSNMYSSARITLESGDSGLEVNILTPDNITEVTKEMYMNALLTAGAENVTVDVVSPVKVSGHSALTGIYKAYDVEGVELDKDRMELANDELEVATDLADNEDVSDEDVSTLLTEIKKMIAEQNPVTKEEVEQIVNEQLNNLDIQLNDADRQMLIDLVNRMRDLDIDFGSMKEQLEDITNNLVERAEDLGLDEGFWQKVANFFSDIFRAISNFFSS